MTRAHRLTLLTRAQLDVARLTPEFAAAEARFERARTEWHLKMRELAVARGQVMNLERACLKEATQ